ncbi:LytR/AlgR family response regulator transcription factor [Maribacter hydrothermalis]|uniref:DNA-binding response regulator n=1 Tax=Maribacter hydrothermalis TaxID=1836467 RepID=A0A1B7ZFL7_9FLAO|nr:LytTR family DNA-binding domain-containing protein [Maribacter hydrothermalis]APQ17868.1 DNA-binding response regulator [Maribacter hydrothermalis]OBR42341.1 DNA-binding response regulator [Maribacter hydrothermalis]
MSLKAILVEDEANSREILRNYIAKYCPSINLVGEASSIKEALVLIENNVLDIVFLDVEMPFGNAFDLLEQLPDRTFETVFVTAYDHYAKDALNNHAAYYLTKPINIDELINAVNYVEGVREKEASLEGEVLTTKTKGVEGKLTLPQQDGFQILNVSEILYCKADDNYTEIYLLNKKILVSKTLKYFEDALTEFPFARVHKSYLVNVNEVVKYRKGKGGSVVMSNGKELMVSASKKKDFLAFFN